MDPSGYFACNHFEFISYAPDGLQHPFIAHAFQFIAQTLDMNVNRSGISGIIESPDLVQKLISRKNVIVIGCQKIQQLQFLRRNVNHLARNLELVLLKRDLKIFKSDTFF